MSYTVTVFKKGESETDLSLLGGVTITLYNGNEIITTALTNEDGIVVFEIPEEEYESLSIKIAIEGNDDLIIPNDNISFPDGQRELTVILSHKVELPTMPF